MSDHTLDAFETLAVAFPFWAEKLGESAVELWCGMVQEIEPDLLSEAIRRLVRTAKFPPSIAEIHATAQTVAWERRHNGRTMADVMAEARRGGC